MDKVRIGIIGMGGMGCNYAQMIAEGRVPEMEIAAVTRIKIDRREWAEQTLPKETPVFQSDRELLTYAEMDAVLIATPHLAHAQQTVEALKRGFHVLCDKPAGVSIRQARMMNEEASRHKLVYAMIFNQRTNPLYRKMRDLVQSGRYGGLKRVNWIITDWYRPEAYYRADAWRGSWDRDGGGILLNQCPHNLDLLQWICGMPSMVRAFCHEGKWHDIQVEDEVTAYLEFPTGATGVFIASTGEAPGTNRLEITLDDARLICEGGRLEVYELDGKEREFNQKAKHGYEKPTGHLIYPDITGENLQHVGILRNFAAAVLRGEELIAPGEEGIHSLMISNAMYLSSWMGENITFPIDEELFLQKLQSKISV